jgi:hypothetical protein
LEGEPCHRLLAFEQHLFQPFLIQRAGAPLCARRGQGAHELAVFSLGRCQPLARLGKLLGGDSGERDPRALDDGAQLRGRPLHARPGDRTYRLQEQHRVRKVLARGEKDGTRASLQQRRMGLDERHSAVVGNGGRKNQL